MLAQGGDYGRYLPEVIDPETGEVLGPGEEDHAYRC